MKYELGDILALENDVFMVTESATYMDINYLLLNKLDSEQEPTNELYVYKAETDGLSLVSDKGTLDIMMPVFTNKLQRNINIINNEKKYNID